MKKIFLAITAIVITAGAYAQSDQKIPASSDTAVYQASKKEHADGYMMKNGKMMCVKDRKMTLLKSDTTLTNGTIVMSNGNYIRKGETKMMFKEGQHMDMNGVLVLMANDPSKKTGGNKKMYLLKDTVKIKQN